ncbi:MAG: RNA methyltransferase [Deltaproteobacteria bacterium]|nr:RNA methyltransferase [Deltaproteobacteria bacterium]
MSCGSPDARLPEAEQTALRDRVVRITSLDDPRVAEYRDIRDADLARRRRLFLAEGDFVLRTLLGRGRFGLRSLFMAQGRLTKLAPLCAKLPASVPIYVAEQALVSGIVGFRFHRGLLAAGERGEPLDAARLLAGLGAGPRLVVALESLCNHDNVGGVFRNAAAFGADAVLLDERCCDPLYRRSIRVSVGATLWVPFAQAGPGLQMVAKLREAGFAVLALTPRPDADDLWELVQDGSLPERVALLLGTEGPGLTEELLGAADRRVRIPIDRRFDALNVATASGIALCAVRRRLGWSRSPAPFSDALPAGKC